MSSEFNQVNKLKEVPHQNENSSTLEIVTRGSRVKESPNDGKFIERLIKISRVTKVTKGGKKLSFRAVVVIGN